MSLFHDIISFKILCAEYFLEKIPNIFPSEHDPSYFETEMFMESFLFFIVASLDVLYSEINTKLKLGIYDHYLTRDLETTLEKSELKLSLLILIELQKYTQKPTHEEKQTTREDAHIYAKKYLNDNWGLDFWQRFENRNGVFYEHIWNRQNSSLWEIRRLRNQITHGSTTKQSGEIGGYNRNALSIHLVNDAYKSHDMHFVFNLHQYFTKCVVDVQNLVKSVRKILE